MNPRIIFQFKSVCGVVKRGFMLVFDEGCIRSDIWKIKHEKMGENTQVGHFSESSTGTTEVPNRFERNLSSDAPNGVIPVGIEPLAP